MPVLTDFSLTVEPNQTVALVGASGSGKIIVFAALFMCYEFVLISTRMFTVGLDLYADVLST